MSIIERITICTGFGKLALIIWEMIQGWPGEEVFPQRTDPNNVISTKDLGCPAHSL